MSDKRMVPSDVAFTAAVKAVQQRKGSRRSYARMEEAGGWSDEIDDELAAFIGAQRSFYLGTASGDGQPYLQHRGGPQYAAFGQDGSRIEVIIRCIAARCGQRSGQKVAHIRRGHPLPPWLRNPMLPGRTHNARRRTGSRR